LQGLGIEASPWQSPVCLRGSGRLGRPAHAAALGFPARLWTRLFGLLGPPTLQPAARCARMVGTGGSANLFAGFKQSLYPTHVSGKQC